MAADAKGNDVTAVGIPISGRLAWAPAGTPIPSPAEGKSTTLTLDAEFTIAGLITTDGGFEWTLEPSGDPIDFFQEGYSIPSGEATAELVVTFAQTDEEMRRLTRGKTADENGYITVDAGGTANQYVIFTEEIFKNGVIRRRIAPLVSIKTVKETKDTRGQVTGYTVTFTIKRSALVGGDHFGEWLIPASTVPAPTITGVSPSSAAEGETITVTGTNLTGATALTVGGAAATGVTVSSATELTATMPAGEAGTVSVTVTTPGGTSTPFSYTRGA